MFNGNRVKTLFETRNYLATIYPDFTIELHDRLTGNMVTLVYKVSSRWVEFMDEAERIEETIADTATSATAYDRLGDKTFALRDIAG